MSIITINMPVISTGHLDVLTAEALTLMGDKNEWCLCAGYQHGYFLFLGDHGESWPQCLCDICDWLQKHGFHDCWVRLDRDAKQVEDLPYYDW